MLTSQNFLAGVVVGVVGCWAVRKYRAGKGSS